MTYQVLARKWRPHAFREMVGQEHVLRALINGLDNDRLHHAFLFTGTRGVGKTTVARIFAKALNCESGVGSEPCGVCSACREIDEGRFVDLIEVDAASRTKVDDTRELLDNVQYAPTRGRFKVYLIDEVHMLSTHSFNALLKTLEEPPPHVKFLLATTDPQRLPVTVLSRCMQFSLNRLSVTQIANQIRFILKEESVSFEDPAIEQLARAADGSMRDALSLVDQAIAFGGGGLVTTDVQSMLGTISSVQITAILKEIAAGDARAVMDKVGGLAARAPDFSGLLAEMLVHLQRIALVQAVPGALSDEWEEQEAISELASILGREEVQLYYQIALIGRRDLPLSPEPRGGFEMVLLRMLSFRPADTAAAGSAPGVLRRNETAMQANAAPGESDPSGQTRTQNQKASQAPSNQQAESPALSREPAAVQQRTATPVVDARVGDAEATAWNEQLDAMGLRGMVRQLAEHCVPVSEEGAAMVLCISPDGEQLRTPGGEKRLEDALSEHRGKQLRVTFISPEELQRQGGASGVGGRVSDSPAAPAGTEQQQVESAAVVVATPADQKAAAMAERQRAAEASIANDPNVQALEEQLGARLIPNSIQPEG